MQTQHEHREPLDRPRPAVDAPLLPFEERTLNYLKNQVEALSPRVRAALYDHIAGDPEFHRS